MKIGIESVGPGRKDDGGKIRVDLLPIGALQEVARVLTFGANKYGANNWQNVEPRSRYYGAALRHLFARGRGETHDSESGLPHLAHAACCILFLLSAEAGFDDPEAWEDDAEEPHGFDTSGGVDSMPKEEIKATSAGSYNVTLKMRCKDVSFDRLTDALSTPASGAV
jgi:hypothetical protein